MKILLPLLAALTLLLSSCSQATADVQTVELSVTGMTCENCVQAITTAMNDLPGMQQCTVSLEDGKAVLTVDANVLTPDQVATRISQLGFQAHPAATGE